MEPVEDKLVFELMFLWNCVVDQQRPSSIINRTERKQVKSNQSQDKTMISLLYKNDDR
jgi:hypothetical protein